MNEPRELEEIKERIRGRLRRQRAISEQIWDTAADMLLIDRRGLWQAEVGAAGRAEVATYRNSSPCGSAWVWL